MMTPELINKIAEWRRKAEANELTLEEQREAIRVMRESRLSAASAPSSKAKPTKSADELLSELDSI